MYEGNAYGSWRRIGSAGQVFALVVTLEAKSLGLSLPNSLIRDEGRHYLCVLYPTLPPHLLVFLAQYFHSAIGGALETQTPPPRQQYFLRITQSAASPYTSSLVT